MRANPRPMSFQEVIAWDRNCGSISGMRQIGPEIATGKNAMYKANSKNDGSSSSPR